MSLNLMYITNKPEVAEIVENSGVDWVFVDLEINGKEARQGHLDSVISRHDISDIKIIKAVLKKSKLLVRVNPIHESSDSEVNQVIKEGADLIMLPYFKSKMEVESFIKFVDKRAKTVLLLETPEAVENLDDILKVEGIDYIHIGLNDLHLGYRMVFMFELLSNGMIDDICSKIKSKGIPYGFGGIAQLGKGELPSELILTEHYRLGSSMVILSRSFFNSNKNVDLENARVTFYEGIKQIREFERELMKKDADYFVDNRDNVIKCIANIKSNLDKDILKRGKK